MQISTLANHNEDIMSRRTERFLTNKLSMDMEVGITVVDVERVYI